MRPQMASAGTMSRDRPAYLHGAATPFQQVHANRGVRSAARQSFHRLLGFRRGGLAQHPGEQAQRLQRRAQVVRQSRPAVPNPDQAAAMQGSQDANYFAMRTANGAACQVRCQTRSSPSGRTNTASAALRSRQARSSGSWVGTTRCPLGF